MNTFLRFCRLAFFSPLFRFSNEKESVKKEVLGGFFFGFTRFTSNFKDVQALRLSSFDELG
jgi:hypothetical protein